MVKRIFCVVLLCICSYAIGYNVSNMSKVKHGNDELKKYFDSGKTNEVEFDNLQLYFPSSLGEYINYACGENYSLIMGDPTDTEMYGLNWIENEKYLITPYECSHWTIAQTPNGVPIVLKYTDLTLIDTSWSRRATCSDVFHDFYQAGDILNVKGKVTRSKINIKYVAETIEGGIASLGTSSDATQRNRKIDNYLIDGKTYDCIFVLAEKIYS